MEMKMRDEKKKYIALVETLNLVVLVYTTESRETTTNCKK